MSAQLPDEAQEALALVLDLDARIADLEVIRDEAAAVVKAAVADDTEARIGDELVLTYAPVTRRTLDTKALREYLGADIAEKFTRETVTRPFRIDRPAAAAALGFEV